MIATSTIPHLDRRLEVMCAPESPYLSPGFQWQHGESVELVEQKNGGETWENVQVVARGVIVLEGGKWAYLLEDPCDFDVDQHGNEWHNPGPQQIPAVEQGNADTRRILIPSACLRE